MNAILKYKSQIPSIYTNVAVPHIHLSYPKAFILCSLSRLLMARLPYLKCEHAVPSKNIRIVTAEQTY